MSYISAITKNNKVYVWERTVDGNRVLLDYPAPYYFYFDDPEGEYETIFDTPVSKIEFRTSGEYNAAKKKFQQEGITTWESDIPAELRLLSNKYYNKPAPKLNITMLDIEVDYDPNIGFSTVQNPYAPINACALVHEWTKEIVVLAVPPPLKDGEAPWTEDRLQAEVKTIAPNAPLDPKYHLRIVMCADEVELLLNILAEIEDSDILSGWNSDFFDMPYIAMRIAMVLDNVKLDLSTRTDFDDRTGKPKLSFVNNPNPEASKCRFLKQLDFDTHGSVTFRPVATDKGKLMGITIDMIGRVKVDYMNLVKKYEPGERASYKLKVVSESVLVDDKTKEPLLPKLEYEGSLADLYRENFAFFIRYNIRDTEILSGFEQKLGYVDLANLNVHLSTALFTHVQGTLKLAELALINYCHHTLKRVVKNITAPEIDRQIDGALVLLPQVGMHDLMGSIDITSLYPSGIRSLNISIETIRGQFAGFGKDAQEIALGSNVSLTFVLESTKQEIVATAAEWREWLLKKKWAVSGYGTVFDQTKQGFIPAILTEWFAMRKKYQALKKQAQDAGDADLTGYYDRLQYVFKIKLNSLYGALTNLYFRFYDLRMGESTTGTGRAILKHQCRMVASILDGNYDVDFPLYDTIDDAIDAGYSMEEAHEVSLHGRKFGGQFQTESVIYGDTDSCYFLTHADNISSAIKLADAVAEKVNASFQEFMRRTFLCTDGYDTLIKAGREVVSDRGIFVEKKRYFLHLVDLDGKAVDKIKVMGLDTKKSTLPQEVSDQINKFVERLLKGETWMDISQSVVEYKDRLIDSSNIMDLGLPKGVKGIEDYTQEYERDPKCRLPGHVAASIYYNECLTKYSDTHSGEIYSGMKIKVFYLLGKHGKFKSIAIPSDIEVVPSWFLENFQVDRKAHIKRLVDNPLENIIRAIGERSPTKQSMYVASTVEF